MSGPSDVVSVQILALHMSDGLVDARASALFFVVAILGVGIAAWKTRTDLAPTSVPAAALVTALVFALQAVNVPVLPGTSGHVAGGALAALLLGPFPAALALTVVLLVQAFVFADGGLSALGSNVTNMAIVAVAAGFLTATAVRALCRRHGVSTTAGLAIAAFGSGLVSIFAAALGFMVEYALGGPVAVAPSTIGYLFATHVPVGLVEGTVTAAVVVAVAFVAPRSVYLLGTPHDVRPPAILMWGLAAGALIVAGVFAPIAATSPDALESATTRGCETGSCMARDVEDHRLAGSALADYTVGGQPGSSGVAVGIGTLAAFALSSVCFRALTTRPVVRPSRTPAGAG